MYEMKDMIDGCCVCLEVDGWDDNPIVFCDGQGCNVGVHKDCYGIVTVPCGPWFCKKCESRETLVRCELCLSKTGAFKRTDNGKWAHVVCALYIPEIGFGNLQTMEPIILNHVPPNRFQMSCCICDTQGNESNTKVGACMNCNKPGCKNHFHVTCAQAMGLLCEEAGNFSAVKYCGYCPHHLSQLKKEAKLKTVPAIKSPLAVAGPSKPALDKYTSSALAKNLQHSPGSYSTKHEIKERKRKKSSCKASTGAGNRELTSEFTTVLAGVGLTPKSLTKETDKDHGEALRQEAGGNTDSSKSSGSKKIKLPRFVSRVPSLIRRISAPAMTSVEHPFMSISSQIERTTIQEDPAESNASASLCSGNQTESASTSDVASLISVIGPSTSVMMTLSSTSDVEQVEAGATAGSSSLNDLRSTSPKSTHDTVKELHEESIPAPIPQLKKPRRSRGQKAPPLAPGLPPSSLDSSAEKHSSKRRKKEENEIPEKAPSFAVDTQSADDLLHPADIAEPKQPETDPETITRRAMSPSFHLQEHSLPEAPHGHLQTGSPESFTGTKPPTTQQKKRISAPQMMDNELNLTSNTAEEMLESSELDTHNAFVETSPTTTSSSLVGVPLPLRNLSSAINSTMAALSSAPAPRHLEDLLERQWEQGSQFLMEQAQHYDIASLLSCLHVIRQGNMQLEDQVAGLIQRRDHLLAVNARLTVPLNLQPVSQAPFVTNIGNRPDGTSVIGSFIGQSIDKGSSMTEQLPCYRGTGSRIDKIHHPIHPTGGLLSTMSPVQGSTGVSSFTPEMAPNTGTPTTKQQLPGFDRLIPPSNNTSSSCIQSTQCERPA